MDRNKYIKMCQQCAMLEKEICGTKQDVPNQLLVEYESIKYYPYRFMMGFNQKGETLNIAILHNLNNNGIIECNLEKVVCVDVS